MAAIDTTEEKIKAWRIEGFELMGFDPEDAELLAIAKDDRGRPLDTHGVRKLVLAGCSQELAKRILL